VKPRGIFVTGTDTGVGKTVVAGAIAGLLRVQGIDTGVMKPVQSGCAREGDRLISEDARFLAKAAGVADEPVLINPYCLEAPVSPHVAARVAGIQIDPRTIKQAFEVLLQRHELVVVEGAGGLLVPLTDDFLVADLIVMLELPILVVARANLGTINHTLLTIRHAQHLKIRVAGTVINGYDSETAGLAEQTSPATIERLSGVPLWGILPRMPTVDVGSASLGNLLEIAGRCLDIAGIQKELKYANR
jgi:dethiobiotin synthetase